MVNLEEKLTHLEKSTVFTQCHKLEIFTENNLDFVKLDNLKYSKLCVIEFIVISFVCFLISGSVQFFYHFL